jgi:hypothetical protein
MAATTPLNGTSGQAALCAVTVKPGANLDRKTSGTLKSSLIEEGVVQSRLGRIDGRKVSIPLCFELFQL